MCIWWGWRGASLNLGKLDTRYCPVCERERDFVVSVTYSYSNVFFVPLFSWGTKYYYHCQVCQNGYEVKGDQLQLTEDPKPFMHRLGWVVVALAFVTILAFAWVVDHY